MRTKTRMLMRLSGCGCGYQWQDSRQKLHKVTVTGLWGGQGRGVAEMSAECQGSASEARAVLERGTSSWTLHFH